MKTSIFCALPLLTLAILIGCGGSSSKSTPPKTLYYTDPAPDPAAWRLVTASGNGTPRLILKLLGPLGTATRGAAFTITADPSKATWAMLSDAASKAAYATNGGALDLSIGAVQLFKTKLDASSGTLQTGIFQKSGASTLATTPLLLLALDIKSDAAPGAVALSAASNAVHLDASSAQPITQPITLSIGVLQVQ